ncbi:MAG TPA: hypothetical protein VKG91_00420 [Roseiarcus sp.]|nr:hypothetical protein [Roseiarcus sp.]
MTAAPIRNIPHRRPPTTAFAGAHPFAPKPIRAANLALLRAAEPPFDVDPPVPNTGAALARRENTPPRPLAAARPIAKSP